jgi:monoamine oxidase
VTFDTAGGVVEDTFDRVVFALPFTMLRRVDLSGAGLSAGKESIIRTLGYGTNAKLMLGFTGRPWRTGASAASGGSVSDVGDLQATWETSRGYPGAAGILTNFVGGDRGVAIGAGTADERATEVLPWLDGSSPAPPPRISPGRRCACTGRPRATPPGATRATGSGRVPWQGLEGEAEGAFHFCGEHTSVEAQGYMEGAAETGLRAADEILTAFGLAPGPSMRQLLAVQRARPRRRRRRRGTHAP